MQAWPIVVAGRPELHLRLACRQVVAVFELDLDQLAAWLEETYEVVPSAEECRYVDWDAHAADLLSW